MPRDLRDAMPTPGNAIIAVLAVVVIWVLLRWLRRRLALAMMRSMPRMHPDMFVFRVRDAFFLNPFGTIELLFGDARDAYIKKHWQDARPPRQLLQADVPADGLHVHRTHLADGRAIAVIVCPLPQRDGEPYFIAVVLPTDPALRADVQRARGEARFFYLNRSSIDTDRDTDLCGWTADGHKREYNVGGPLDPDGFAAVVGAKLLEIGL